jgi:hypothetical protein
VNQIKIRIDDISSYSSIILGLLPVFLNKRNISNTNEESVILLK